MSMMGSIGGGGGGSSGGNDFPSQMPFDTNSSLGYDTQEYPQATPVYPQTTPVYAQQPVLQQPQYNAPPVPTQPQVIVLPQPAVQSTPVPQVSNNPEIADLKNMLRQLKHSVQDTVTNALKDVVDKKISYGRSRINPTGTD